MSTSKGIAVKDACILFDLLDLDLMENFYELNLTVYTTPQVISEIADEEQLTAVSVYINDGRLKIDNGGDLDSIQLITEENPGLSATDGSVIEVAIRRGCTILSSDGSLRRVSERRSIVVRGMLWIIQELYNQRIITREVAIVKLQLLPEINQRVPRREINNMVERLGNNDESSNS